MLRSLQTRLVLSYAMVIAVCLALVGLASLVLLCGDQRNLVYSRLSDGSVLAAAVTSQVLREGDSRREAADRMVQQLNRGDVIPTSVYILDREGAVVAYSGESVGPVCSSDLPARCLGQERLWCVVSYNLMPHGVCCMLRNQCAFR